MNVNIIRKHIESAKLEKRKEREKKEREDREKTLFRIKIIIIQFASEEHLLLHPLVHLIFCGHERKLFLFDEAKNYTDKDLFYFKS